MRDQYEVWWVDSWLLVDEEPHASAVKLEEVPDRETGLRRLHSQWVQWHAGKYGRGQLVLLETQPVVVDGEPSFETRCVGGPVPVKRRKACTVPRLGLAGVRVA